MNLLKPVADLWEREQRHYLATDIPPESVMESIDTDAIEPNQHYFRLWLSDFSLQNERERFQGRFPIVYSTLRVLYDGEPLYISCVTDAAPLVKHDPTGALRLIQGRYLLSPVIPYTGDSVELFVGLFSQVNDDVIKSLFGILTDISKPIPGSLLSSIAGMANTLYSSLTRAFELKDLQMQIGYHNTFADVHLESAKLRGQYIAVMRAEENVVNREHLCVINGQLRLKKTDANPVTVADTDAPRFDYFLLYLERRTTLPNYQTLKGVNALMKACRSAIVLRQVDEERKLRDQLFAAIATSPDLTDQDRYDMIKKIAHELEKMRQQSAMRSDNISLQELMHQAEPPLTPSLEVELKRWGVTK